MTVELLAGTGISALIAISFPFLMYRVFRPHMALPARNILIGAAVFVVLVLVLESMVHGYLLIGNPVSKAWFDTHPIGYAVYAAGAAAVFEETGRLLAFRFLARRVDGNGTPVSYAIGHGGVECLVVGLNIAVIGVIGFLIMTGQAQSLKLDSATASSISKMFEGTTFFTNMLGGFERVFAAIFQLAMSFLVWKAVTSGRGSLFFAALFFHFLIDFPAALMQKKVIPLTVYELEAGYAVAAALVVVGLWAFAWPQKRSEVDDDRADDQATR